MKLLFFTLLIVSGFQITILYASSSQKISFKSGMTIEVIEQETEEAAPTVSTTSASVSSSAGTVVSMSAQASATQSQSAITYSSSAVTSISAAAAAAAATPSSAGTYFPASQVSELNDALSDVMFMIAAQNAASANNSRANIMAKLAVDLKNIDLNKNNIRLSIDRMQASVKELNKIDKKKNKTDK